MFQELNGDPKPEHEWPTDRHRKRLYPHLFPYSSSELEDDQEEVGHRNKVKRRHSFAMSFLFEIHFSSLLVVLINRAVYTRENKPRLTLAAAYIRRERNDLYEYGLY